MMDQGEPGKDLPIEQAREVDPHETESSKKMEATTEPTPDTLTATTERSEEHTSELQSQN